MTSAVSQAPFQSIPFTPFIPVEAASIDPPLAPSEFEQWIEKGDWEKAVNHPQIETLKRDDFANRILIKALPFYLLKPEARPLIVELMQDERASYISAHDLLCFIRGPLLGLGGETPIAVEMEVREEYLNIFLERFLLSPILLENWIDELKKTQGSTKLIELLSLYKNRLEEFKENFAFPITHKQYLSDPKSMSALAQFFNPLKAYYPLTAKQIMPLQKWHGWQAHFLPFLEE